MIKPTLISRGNKPETLLHLSDTLLSNRHDSFKRLENAVVSTMTVPLSTKYDTQALGMALALNESIHAAQANTATSAGPLSLTTLALALLGVKITNHV